MSLNITRTLVIYEMRFELIPQCTEIKLTVTHQAYNMTVCVFFGVRAKAEETLNLREYNTT